MHRPVTIHSEKAFCTLIHTYRPTMPPVPQLPTSPNKLRITKLFSKDDADPIKGAKHPYHQHRKFEGKPGLYRHAIFAVVVWGPMINKTSSFSGFLRRAIKCDQVAGTCGQTRLRCVFAAISVNGFRGATGRTALSSLSRCAARRFLPKQRWRPAATCSWQSPDPKQ